MSFGKAPKMGQIFCKLFGLFHLAEEEVTLRYFGETVNHVTQNVVPRISEGVHLVVSHPGQSSEVLNRVDEVKTLRSSVVPEHHEVNLSPFQDRRDVSASELRCQNFIVQHSMGRCSLNACDQSSGKLDVKITKPGFP